MSELTRQQLISLMVGRELTEIFPKVNATVGDVVMTVRGLTRRNEFRDVSFDLHAGEILGIGGLMGAGRTEIVSTIFGERRPDTGEVRVRGRALIAGSTRDAVQQEDRIRPRGSQEPGAEPHRVSRGQPVHRGRGATSNAGMVRKRIVEKAVDRMIQPSPSRWSSRNQRVGTLSGGNQQKVVLGKWLLSEPDVVILDEPTRGIDVGAKAEIYRLIGQLAASGKAVLMISSEMPEIMGLCDRVIVLHDGALIGELSRAELSQENLMTLASGMN